MNYEYCNGFTHTIKKGDTLYEISRKHNVPLALLLRANPYVDVFNLQVGDTICIPSENSQTVPYPVNTMPVPCKNDCSDDRMEAEEKEKNSSRQNVVMNMPRQADAGKSDDKEGIWVKYVVKPGDTLADIMEQMDGDMEAFVKRNGLSSIYMLPGVAYYMKKKKD